MSEETEQNSATGAEYDGFSRVVGTCMDMCPSEEVTLRVNERLVHVLEVTESGNKLVKCYSRPAASANMAVPRLLRPYQVLYDTVQYLLFEVSNRKDVKAPVLYDFLNDRLRAVRQDMIIQCLPSDQCVTLLEPMIRFYVYYGYRLCEHPLHEYDPVLNKTYLLECLKWFLCSYDIIDRRRARQNAIEGLVGDLAIMDVNKGKEGTLACDRLLVESLYILCTMNDWNVQPLFRYLSLPNYVKASPMLKLTYQIAVTDINGNFTRMWKLAQGLCPLTFSVLCLYLPSLQRKSLLVLSKAYHSRQLSVPLRALRRWLAFNSEEEARRACAHYGLDVRNGVHFNSNTFRNDVNELPPKYHNQAKLSHMSLADVLSYTI